MALHRCSEATAVSTKASYNRKSSPAGQIPASLSPVLVGALRPADVASPGQRPNAGGLLGRRGARIHEKSGPDFLKQAETEQPRQAGVRLQGRRVFTLRRVLEADEEHLCAPAAQQQESSIISPRQRRRDVARG